MAIEQYFRCDICSIVKLKRMASMWRRLVGQKQLPRDVPPGHLAVIVGETRRRFVIRTDYLNHPVFQQLLHLAHEEYGYNKIGPLTIPCKEFFFDDILSSLRRGTSKSQFSCPVAGHALGFGSWSDSRPLLHDLK